MERTEFVDVILPVPIPRRFTYRLPRDMSVEQGMRIAVPFGKRRVLTGIADQVHHNPPEKYEARYVYEVLDTEPVFLPVQIRFLDWLANYYMAAPGEVLHAALPSGLKISSDSYVQLHPAASEEDFDEEFTTLYEALQANDTLNYQQVQEILGEREAFKSLQYLAHKGLVILYDEIRERYTPQREKYLQLSEQYQEEDQLNQLFEDLARAPKQEEALLIFLQQIRSPGDGKSLGLRIRKAGIKDEGASPAALQQLLKKGIFIEHEEIVSRFPEVKPTNEHVQLSTLQQKAFDEITNLFETKNVTLLHGVTGSGKTEIYMQLIRHILENNMQVLYLLPEIALTTQIVERLKKVFGDKLGVYHSRFSDNERVEVWQGVLSGRYSIVVGVRSSLFLPFDNLGLVIVDEEHEHSYKQFDPAPRYHARDAAMMLASFHHAKTILGSATPSLESSFLARQGKYGYVRLNSRFGQAQQPEVKLVNVLKKSAKKQMHGTLSDTLVTEIREALDRREQIILFQNRRGYAPYLSCGQCGHIPHCSQCSVSLTYHQFGERLVCHYCGMQESVPVVCEACGAAEMKTMGTGTEKLEEELSLLYPEARIQRMDLDTTRTKNSFERILNDFAAHQSDILVGTQMVTKGLDFGNVSLVGVVDLDMLLHYPDFRSHERAFQMAIQVSGRAGRRDHTGKVIIQTRDVEHPVVRQIMDASYDAFLNSELEERQLHFYPPYSRMIKITLKHKDRNVVHEAGHELGKRLSGALPVKVLGPHEPLINRIRNEYLNELWIKINRSEKNLARIKHMMMTERINLQQRKIFRSLKVVFNVDPY